MKSFTSVRLLKSWKRCRPVSLVLAAISIMAGVSAYSQVVVTSVTDSKNGTAGYVDGSTFLVAQFHTPMGIAIDDVLDCLYVADRDNNAIRLLDLGEGQTSTFLPNTNTFVPASLISKPVGVQVDADGNVFVLNRGSTNLFSTNGTVLEFDFLSNLIATNATKLTNAAGMAIDSADDIYVTVRSNSVIEITPGGTITTIATITNAGTSLQGIVVKHNGLLAVADSGRNGIYLINPATGLVTTNTGFNGAGDYIGPDNRGATGLSIKYNQPSGVAEAGDGSLIVSDTGNNRVKVISTTGIVTNLYGVPSTYWSGKTPGWLDGTVKVPDSVIPNVQARLPVGLAFASDGSLYTTEDYYQLIRKVTGSGLPQPPPPPTQVPSPMIGWAAFPATSVPIAYTSVFQAGSTNFSSFVFNNDVPIVIEGTSGSQTFYTFGATSGSVPDPTSASTSAPNYQDGILSNNIANFTVAQIMPDLTIKAIGEKNDGSPNSGIVQARFQFITGNPLITGINAAQFTVSDITSGALMYYTTDGSNPTNDGSGTSIGPITNGATLSLNITTNTTFQIEAFRANYQPSATTSTTFSPTNYSANTISFGFASGEASSDFVGAPGQTFYAPVTLTTLPGTLMYSLQFNITVTNVGPHAITPGAFDFQSMLEKPATATNTSETVYTTIEPWVYAADVANVPPSQLVTNSAGQVFVNLETENPSIGLLAVGWAEHYGNTNLYNTLSQDLITFSQAHDDLFPNSQQPNGVIVGGYGFTIPANAAIGEQYQIQIGRPTATSDGVGAPGSSVFIDAPTNGPLAGGGINALKLVTAGQRKYLVGNAYPFRWFNAGDFGNTNLQNADVEQVFESAAYGWNTPPANTDFYDCMDSSGHYGVYDSVHGYYVDGGPLSLSDQLALFNATDVTALNTNMFGDGILDISDVYVTYIRSVDSDQSLNWIQRFWTNGIRAALPTGNVFKPKVQSQTPAITSKIQTDTPSISVTNQPKVNFTAGDIQGSAGQVVQIPITATILGSYPLRVLMLNLTVEPLDGSPALTTPVQFSQTAPLGSPYITDARGNGNFSAAWLNSASNGVTGTVTLGTLTVTIPASASSIAAYAVHFDHASGSPNGFASFPKQTLTGLITLASRTNSSYGDGIPDSWRLRWFGTTNNLLSVSNACPSGDGISNFKKYVAGVDPNTANDFPSVNPLTPAPSGSTSSIYWPSVGGKQYAIERSTSLFTGAWTAIATNTGTSGTMEYDDNFDGPVKFYRVRILQ